MINLSKIVLDGSLLSIIASLLLIVPMYFNPRIFLQDYPKDIQTRVPAKTPREKHLALWVGIPFLLVLLLIPFLSTLSLKQQNSPYLVLFANAFGVAFLFNVVDWLLLDWLLFCTITPKFVVIPGTEGMPGYKDYGFHFRGFLVGTVLSVISGVLIAGIVSFIG